MPFSSGNEKLYSHIYSQIGENCPTPQTTPELNIEQDTFLAEIQLGGNF